MMLFLLLGCTSNNTESEVVEDTAPVIPTVFCSDIEVGETLEVDGILYTKQDREGLDTLIENEDWEGLETSCISDITNMNRLFFEVADFNGDISSWDVSSVTNMDGMFSDASSFNEDISNWDVSNVTNMSSMFRDASSFNQDLSGWCVSNITALPSNFDTRASSWVLDRPVWGTCP